MNRSLFGVISIFLFLVLPACGGGDDSAAGPVPGADGGGDSPEADVCSDACAKIVTCAEVSTGNKFDVRLCVDGCTKELRGEGYIDADVARAGFQAKRDLATNDSSCRASLSLFFEIERGDFRGLSRSAIIDECELAEGSGACASGAAKTAVRAECFELYVKYAPKYRAGYEKCGYPAAPCDSYSSCIQANKLPEEVYRGAPWYGVQFITEP